MPLFEDQALDPQIAAHILHRLGEGGQPPEHGVSAINVGNEAYLRVLEHEYFRQHLRHGASFKLVQGYFGAGKTHFLYCVRELAWRHGFVTAVVELSPAECPYDDPLKVYQMVARRLTMRPRAALAAPNYGLADLLRNHLDDLRDAAEAKAEGRGENNAERSATREVDRWLDRTVGRSACESHSFRQAVVELGRAYLAGDRERERVLEAWLAGEPVPVKEVRPFGVYEQLDRSNGFTMLRCLTQMVVALGLPGTALLFDEAERNMSFSAKRGQAIGDNLRAVIDLCGRHQLPNTLFLYAVPPEFMRNAVPEYPALAQRLKSPMPLSVKSPQAVLIDLERLELEPVALLTALAGRITKVFEVARGVALDAELQRENAELLAEAAAEAYFDVSHRRLFVKTWVDFLYTQLVDGETRLDEAAAQRMVETGYESLNTKPVDDFDDF